MKNIKQTYLIKADIDKVWQALTDPKVIDKWGGGSAEMDEKEGTKFSLWAGDIHGINTNVIRHEKLVQDWYSGDWKNPSSVTFTLTPENNSVRVDLLHEDVPDEAEADIADGWKRYYLGPLQNFLEK